jgi:hypothetical protein
MWGFQWAVDFLNDFWESIKAGGAWIINGMEYGIGTILYSITDGLLTVIYSLVAALDMSALTTSMAANYGLLPTQLVYVLNAICLPQGIAIIVSAIALRMALNLIPAAFTRI